MCFKSDGNNDVFLKATYDFEKSDTAYLKIKIDETSKKICYSRSRSVEVSFDEALYDFSDNTSRYYLDSKSNFYLTERGVNHLNELYTGIDAWEGFDGMLPHLENIMHPNVFIFGATKNKLNEKIYKGIVYNQCKPKFTAKSAAWIIIYQNPNWFCNVLKSISANQADDIITEIINIFESGFKFNLRVAEKLVFFINTFKNKISDKNVEKSDSLFSKNGCRKLNSDYEMTNADILSAVKIYSKVCKDAPHIAWTFGSIDELPSNLKPYAVKNFFFSTENNIADMSEWKENYLEYINKNQKTYLKTASENKFVLNMLINETVLSRKSAENLLEILQEAEDFESISALLVYINNIKSSETKDPLSDNDSDIKRKVSMQKRKEAIKNQKGINGIVFVASGNLEKFGYYDEYTQKHDLLDLQTCIEAHGGTLQGSVSSKTDYLICNDVSSATTKVKKAIELDVTIISEQDFLDMLK